MTNSKHNKTPGQVFTAAREHKNVNIRQVSEVTKMRESYIQALERDDYEAFSSDVHLRGFMKIYCRYLELDDVKILALYRRSVETKPEKSDKEESETKPTRSIQLQQLLQNRYVILGAFGVLLILFYLGNQVYRVLQPPRLLLSSPVEITANYTGTVDVNADAVTLSGQTEPFTVIRINGEALPLQPGGLFELKDFPLTSESTVFSIVGTNQLGREATIQLTVHKQLESMDEQPEQAEQPPADIQE